MSMNQQPYKVLARKVSVRRRYGASMPAAPSDLLRRRCARREAPEGAAETTHQMDQCHARLAAMPTDFLDWLDEVPSWPENARERIGETQGDA